MKDKKLGIFLCLVTFVFQTILFNMCLSGLILYAKAEAAEDMEDLRQLHLTPAQYKKLQWMNQTEIAFGNYLLDVKEIKRERKMILLTYKVDLKEKSFLEEQIEHFKQNKSRKIQGLSSACKLPEPYRMNFVAQITSIRRQNISMVIPLVKPDKSTPPPKD